MGAMAYCLVQVHLAPPFPWPSPFHVADKRDRHRTKRPTLARHVSRSGGPGIVSLFVVSHPVMPC